MATPSTNSNSAARRVFDITELAEQILSHLSVRDVLSVQQVNRKLRDTVGGSLALQKHLFLISDDDAMFRCIEDPTQAMQIDLYYGSKTLLRDGKHFARMQFEFTDTPLRLGDRVREMHVCQPPVTTMDYHVDCCPTPYGRPQKYLKNEAGLKLGEVYDKARELWNAHRLCPNAIWEKLDENGNVKVRVRFVRNVKIRDDDILVARRRETKQLNDLEEQKKVEEQKKAIPHMKRMIRYSMAKQRARDEGRPIPTLAEFEADEILRHHIELQRFFWPQRLEMFASLNGQQ